MPFKDPIYAIEATYQENFEMGPTPLKESKPPLPLLPKEEWGQFLGHPVQSTLGVPAGPLLSGEWVLYAARLGFDLLTYKTVRTQAHPSHPLPNVVVVEKQGDHFIQAGKEPQTPEELSITNSFGMPSQSPEFYLEDIAATQENLPEGKLMIVSVVGSGSEANAVIADYVLGAKKVAEAGAKVVEINLSCPNVSKGGELYLDSEMCEKLCRKVKEALKEVPLIVKVGRFPSLEMQKEMLVTFARCGVEGVAGINTLSAKVLNDKGEPALGKDRLTSGICGEVIREEALQFVRQARGVIVQEALPLTLIGVGGIVRPEHFDAFYITGADSAMCATGMMWDPWIAYNFKASKILSHA